MLNFTKIIFKPYFSDFLSAQLLRKFGVTIVLVLRLVIPSEENFSPFILSNIYLIFQRLNEGFASLFENVINDILFPEKHQWEEFLISNFDFVFDFDTNNWFDPLNQYVETRQDIEMKFGWIARYKGAIVLRMFKEALGDETFLKGVRYYLNDNQYQSVSPKDLFEGLQKAFDEDFPGINLNIESMMTPWLELHGYPIVTVSRSENGITLRQDTFRQSHDELFNIPINYATASHPNFDDAIADIWLTDKEMEIVSENAVKTWTNDDWVIFNLRDTGYFVTNYDDTLWNLIIDALMNDHEAIHSLNRGTLFADFTRFIEMDYDVSSTYFLGMMQSLALENHHHVWRRASGGLRLFELRLRNSDLHQLYLNFMRDFMTTAYSEVTFTDEWGRSIVDNWSCRSGVQNCLDDSLNVLIEIMENDSPLDFFTSHCNGFRAVNETVWMYFFNRALKQNDNWRRIFELMDLACTENTDLLQIYLNSALDMNNSLDRFDRETIINGACRENPTSYRAALSFIEENYEWINTE